MYQIAGWRLSEQLVVLRWGIYIYIASDTFDMNKESKQKICASVTQVNTCKRLLFLNNEVT